MLCLIENKLYFINAVNIAVHKFFLYSKNVQTLKLQRDSNCHMHFICTLMLGEWYTVKFHLTFSQYCIYNRAVLERHVIPACLSIYFTTNRWKMWCSFLVYYRYSAHSSWLYFSEIVLLLTPFCHARNN